MHIFSRWNEKRCFAKIHTLFSYYYYNSCMTFMSNCWLSWACKMFEGRKETAGRDTACGPYFVPSAFEKQTLCKYKGKLFKFACPFTFSFFFFASIFVFFNILGALIHNLESLSVGLYLQYLCVAPTASV